MASARSSEILLYASEDKTVDAKKFRCDVKNAECTMTCAQDFKVDCATYQFKVGSGAARTYFDMVSRFDAIEGDQASATNATAITALQADLATEVANRTSGDVTNANATTAEVTRATTAEGAVQTNLNTQTAIQEADDVAVRALIAAEVSDRATAVAADAAARAASVATLTANFNNILSNTDAAALDSLTEIITAYTAGDTTLANAAAAMLVRIGALEDAVNELVNGSL